MKMEQLKKGINKKHLLKVLFNKIDTNPSWCAAEDKWRTVGAIPANFLISGYLLSNYAALRLVSLTKGRSH